MCFRIRPASIGAAIFSSSGLGFFQHAGLAFLAVELVLACQFTHQKSRERDGVVIKQLQEIVMAVGFGCSCPGPRLRVET